MMKNLLGSAVVMLFLLCGCSSFYEGSDQQQQRDDSESAKAASVTASRNVLPDDFRVQGFSSSLQVGVAAEGLGTVLRGGYTLKNGLYGGSVLSAHTNPFFVLVVSQSVHYGIEAGYVLPVSFVHIKPTLQVGNTDYSYLRYFFQSAAECELCLLRAGHDG
jgi:hypothetical protein